MNGKAAEPRVRGLMLLVPGRIFLFSGGLVSADDIDVLLPETWLSEQWSAFQTLLQAEDWRLIDAREHTFEKRGVHCSFAALEELETWRRGSDSRNQNPRVNRELLDALEQLSEEDLALTLMNVKRLLKK